MKIYKSEIKKIIKEVLNEITEGGPGSGQKGHTTPEEQSGEYTRLKTYYNVMSDAQNVAKKMSKKGIGAKAVRDPNGGWNVIVKKDKKSPFSKYDTTPDVPLKTD